MTHKLTDADVRVMRQIFKNSDCTIALIELLASEFGCSAWYAKRILRWRERIHGEWDGHIALAFDPASLQFRGDPMGPRRVYVKAASCG